MYRDRTKQTHDLIWHACEEQVRPLDPVTRNPIGPWAPGATRYSPGYTRTFEQLKDYSGPVRLSKDCHHVKSTYVGQVHVCNPTVVVGDNEYRLYRYQLDATRTLHGMDADTWPIDKSAVAIGRIPAFASTQAQNLVSGMELLEVGDSLAVKVATSSAVSLARFITKAYRALRNPNPARGEEFLDVIGWTYDPRKKVIRRTGKAFAKSVADKIRHISNTAMQVDMEWKYGWAPLAGEIRESARAIREFDRIKQRLVKGTRLFGRASSSASTTFSGSYDKWPYALYPKTEYSGSRTTTSTWTASVVRRVKPEYAETFLGAGLHDLRIWGEVLNIEPTLANGWQYLPLSFVADWFLPVSELLDALGGLKNPLPHMFECHDPILTCRTITNGECTVVDRSTGQTVTGSLRRETYVRDCNRNLVPTDIYFPVLRTPKGLGKWWSMVEIAVSGFLSGRHRVNKRIKR